MKLGLSDLTSPPTSPRIRASASSLIPATSKPLSAFTPADISQLVYDLGATAIDADILRSYRVDGIAVQGLSQPDMTLDLGLSSTAASAVRQIQRSSRLFNRLARYSNLSRVTELDLQVSPCPVK